jgi:hypothetical protein
MNLPELSRLSRTQRGALAAAFLLIVLLLFLWLGLPRIIHAQAEKYVVAKTGHRLDMARPAFNPFTLELRLAEVRLADAADQTLLAFDTLVVDLSAASLPRRAFVFDAIRLDGLAVTLVELPAGNNWSPFLAAFGGGDPPADDHGGPPRLEVRDFTLAGGSLDYSDRRAPGGFAARVAPLDLNLRDISTLPDDNGRFRLAAHTSLGARFALAGELALNPLVVAGDFELAELELAPLAPLLGGMLSAPPAGVVSLSAAYRVGNAGGKLDASITGAQLRSAGLRVPLGGQAGTVAAIDAIECDDGRFELGAQTLSIGAARFGPGRLELADIAAPPSFETIALDAIRVDFAARAATLGRAALTGARVAATRDAAGGIDLLAALAGLSAGREGLSGEPVREVAPSWRYRLDRLEVAELGATLRDAGVEPAAELALENLAFSVEGASDDLSVPLPLRLAFDVRGGGRFEGEGTATPATPSADVRFKLADLSLKPAEPYLAQRTTLTLADGRLSVGGRATYDGKEPKFRGDFALRNLRLSEAATGDTLLGWKNLASGSVSATPRRLDVGELRLDGLDAKLVIDKDKNVNLKQVLKAAPAAQGDAATDPAGTAPTDFQVNVQRVRVFNSEMYFADHSLVLPFGTRIHGLRGGLGKLTSRPDGAPGQIELEGDVDDYGMARAVGQVNLFDPAGFMDIRVLFRNVEMTRLTPYTATFAGRKIDSGKLSLDLQYRIENRQLQGANQIVMDSLALGERVDSPGAANLPLDLAVAILQDADGRIDLGLPIAGSLDDPEFSYGRIVWKAIANVLTKIVTAPFRALAALFGGDEKIEDIAFEPGMALPTPPEREKLVKLATALGKRPGLVLKVGGTHAPADRIALQDVQLRRALLARTGQRVPERGDPGPLSPREPKMRAALEELFGKRFGASDLAALKEGFRKANPGELQESVAGRMISRLSGLLREKKTLSEAEVADLKGADFPEVLYERLRAAEEIGAGRLKTLATQRAENARAILRTAGLPEERIALLPAAAAEDATTEIPLRLSLEAAGAGAQDKAPESVIMENGKT